MEDLNIHKTAIIHPNTQLASGVSVGPYSIIGPDVTVGEDVRIASHCNIEGKTTVGKGSQLFSGAVVGSIPQDKKHNPDDDVSLVIGDNNVIREYVLINPGTVDGGGKTIIGNNNLFMAYSHIAHDCIIGDGCIVVNSVNLAGHVRLGNRVIIGGGTNISQFVTIGTAGYLGGASAVDRDIPLGAQVGAQLARQRRRRWRIVKIDATRHCWSIGIGGIAMTP